MAGRQEKTDVTLNRDDMNARVSEAGHVMRWQLGENANRAGYGYTLVGECENCGARVIVGRTYSTCDSIRDARHVPCSGPGTSILTDIEADHHSQQMQGPIDDFRRAVRAAQTRTRQHRQETRMNDVSIHEQRMAKRCRRLAADYQRAVATGNEHMQRQLTGMYERTVQQLGYDPLAEFNQPTAKIAADYGIPEQSARRAIHIVDEGVAEGATVGQMCDEIARDPSIPAGEVTDVFVRIARTLGHR